MAMEIDHRSPGNRRSPQQNRRPHSPQLSGPPEIEASEITLDHVLGGGSFGTVYKGRLRQKDVAVKVLYRQFDEKTLEAFRKEVEIMSKIFHPNVSLFMGACTSIPGKLMMCNELLGKDMETLLLDTTIALPLLLRLRMAKDAALGMLWLHSSNPVIIHRDLKSSNLLTDRHGRVKVCDFGLSSTLSDHSATLTDGADGAKGTPLWMAPEVLAGQNFNTKADIYSFGLILWQMVTREDIFPEYDNLEIFARDICRRHVRPSIPAETNQTFVNLIQKCWHPEATQRPDFNEIVANLDAIILEEAIRSPAGRQFWSKSFHSAEQVTWIEFINAFGVAANIVAETLFLNDMLLYQRHGLPSPFIDTHFKCLKAILVDCEASVAMSGDASEIVTVEQFGKTLAWFGDFIQNTGVLERIRTTLEKPWFHGDVSTPNAETRLVNKPTGTFLLRFSSSELGSYTISKVSMFGSITHQRILHKPCSNVFEVNGGTYSSLEALVDRERHALNLITPCPGTRFLALFTKANIQGYVNP